VTKKSLSEGQSGMAQGITRKGKQQSCDKWKEEHDHGRSCRNRTMCGHTGDEIKYNRNRSRMTSEFHVEASQGHLKGWKQLKGLFSSSGSFSSRSQSFSRSVFHGRKLLKWDITGDKLELLKRHARLYSRQRKVNSSHFLGSVSVRITNNLRLRFYFQPTHPPGEQRKEL
jgi:hypothetical protein